MKNTPNISDAEWEVMRAIWEKHPITAAEIIERLSRLTPPWHPKTVRTLLARLVKKGALKYAEIGRSYQYTPLVSEEECVAAESDSFVERIFGGSLKPMLAHFIEQKRLSRADIEELRALLDSPSAKKEPKSDKRHHS